MKNNSLVSVVVPVYNVELYLEECINSILNQTFSNFEVILVDDGSTDRSAEICDEYAKKDERIRVYHKCNGGLSDARNYGIDHSEGEYLTFLDSDDYMEKDYIENLYENLVKNQVEISVVAYRRVDENGEVSYDLELGDSNIFTRKEALLNLFYQKNISVSACGKLYKRELFNEIRFVKGKLYEDILTVPMLIEKCNGVYYSNKPLMNYRIRSNSITESKFSVKSIEMLNNSIEVAKKLSVDRELKKSTYAYILSKGSKLFYMIMKQTEKNDYLDEKEYIWNKIKQVRVSNVFDVNTRINNKVGAIISFLGRKVFVMVFDLKEKRKK